MTRIALDKKNTRFIPAARSWPQIASFRELRIQRIGNECDARAVQLGRIDVLGFFLLYTFSKDKCW